MVPQINKLLKSKTLEEKKDPNYRVSGKACQKLEKTFVVACP